MHVKCWSCNNEIDTISIEHQTINSIMELCISQMCEETRDNKCPLWWKHDDCNTYMYIINELEDKLL